MSLISSFFAYFLYPHWCPATCSHSDNAIFFRFLSRGMIISVLYPGQTDHITSWLKLCIEHVKSLCRTDASHFQMLDQLPIDSLIKCPAYDSVSLYLHYGEDCCDILIAQSIMCETPGTETVWLEVKRWWWAAQRPIEQNHAIKPPILPLSSPLVLALGRTQCSRGSFGSN